MNTCRRFSLWKIVGTGIHIGYIVFLIAFAILAKNEQVGLDRFTVFLLLTPFAVGQYCDFHAEGEGQYAKNERFIAGIITVFEAFLMSAAVIAFITLRASNQNPDRQTIKEYWAADISEITLEVTSGVNAPRYYSYCIDMENNEAVKAVFTYQYYEGEGQFIPAVSEYGFSQETADELISMWDTAFLTRWNSSYRPEYKGEDDIQLRSFFYVQLTRGGQKNINIKFKDGTSKMTCIYDGAEGLPRDCGKVLDSIYGLCGGGGADS